MGYSKYAEAGPLEADPLLVSMVDSAFENGRFEVKDAGAVSFGTKLLPMGSSNSNNSSALCADDPINPFLSLHQMKLSAEVTYNGILIYDATGASDAIDFESNSSHSGGRKGFQIDASPALEVSCCLPCSLIITVPTSKHFYYTTPLPKEENTDSVAAEIQGETIKTPRNKNRKKKSKHLAEEGEKASGEPREVEKKEENSESENKTMSEEEDKEDKDTSKSDGKEKSEAEAGNVSEESNDENEDGEESHDEENDSECSDSTETTLASNLPEPPAHSMGCEWIGDTTGELYTQTAQFMSQITGKGIKSYRVCIVCSDRIQRDALVLSIRLLAGFDSSASVRQRLAVMPWYESGAASISGPLSVSPDKKPERRTSVSMAMGGDVTKRLRELEAENAALRRAKNELTVQLVEQESDGGFHSRGHRSESAAAGDDGEGHSEQLQALKHKLRELENKISSAHHREVCVVVESNSFDVVQIEAEKQNMELNNRVKRLSSEIDALGVAGAEMQERLMAANSDAAAARAEAAKHHGEVETLKKKLADIENEVKQAVRSIA